MEPQEVLVLKYLDSDGFLGFLARRPFAGFWGESEGHH